MDTDRERAASNPVSAGVQTAAFGFACVLAAGAVLLLGAKLQVPDLGAGASPLTIFETTVIVGLAALGAPVDVGGVFISTLPLGALLFVCLGIATGARRAFAPADPKGRGSEGLARSRPASATLPAVLVTAAALAMLCGAAAWLFRPANDVHVDPLPAAAAAGVWGAVASGVGAWLPRPRALFAFVRRRRSTGAGATWARDGVLLATWVMLCSLAALVVFAATRGSPSPAGAIGWLVHGLAFAPNLAAAGAALGLGAPVEAGFGGLASSQQSPTYSLLDWPGGAVPAIVWILPLAILACMLAMGARVALHDTSGTPPLRLFTGIALVFAGLLALVALAGDARAGLVENEGFARLAPDAPQVFVLGLGWSAVGLPLGWAIARALGRRRHREAR